MINLQEERVFNIGMELLDVNPQAWAQSHKVPTKDAKSWFPDRSSSINVRLLHSCKIIDIKHNGVKFQIFFDECFPNLFLHSNKRSITLSGT